MRKRWVLKLKDDPGEEEFKFGEVVYTGDSWFFTVHHTQKHSVFKCDMCQKWIACGEYYVRFHTPRNPDTGVQGIDRRHLHCVMPPDIEYIRVKEIS